ncbi:hypothetical protein [Erythrobacter rubeus]|uniref:Nucleotidyltransferase family protein n=1 Tax=Erythrobacter rubeus TaxID=2760803 RepID=A0ABR8KPH4_9SPHN|nr:hypothetical protein [Erythrobacter rubeus]MBD2841350.1 hypothetical protein [Erythrobacter rubeus]
MIEPALRSALRDVAGAMAQAEQHWWIIGSAAVALHGADPGTIADVDVLLAKSDLTKLARELQLSGAPDARKARFRSSGFGIWTQPALPVEFMADLELRRGGDWISISLQTRQEMTLCQQRLFVPEKHELIAILRRFGREKDLARAAALGG